MSPDRASRRRTNVHGQIRQPSNMPGLGALPRGGFAHAGRGGDANGFGAGFGDPQFAEGGQVMADDQAGGGGGGNRSLSPLASQYVNLAVQQRGTQQQLGALGQSIADRRSAFAKARDNLLGQMQYDAEKDRRAALLQFLGRMGAPTRSGSQFEAIGSAVSETAPALAAINQRGREMAMARAQTQLGFDQQDYEMDVAQRQALMDQLSEGNERMSELVQQAQVPIDGGIYDTINREWIVEPAGDWAEADGVLYNTRDPSQRIRIGPIKRTAVPLYNAQTGESMSVLAGPSLNELEPYLSGGEWSTVAPQGYDPITLRNAAGNVVTRDRNNPATVRALTDGDYTEFDPNSASAPETYNVADPETGQVVGMVIEGSEAEAEAMENGLVRANAVSAPEPTEVTRLFNELQEAQAAGENDRAARLQAQIDNLTAPQLSSAIGQAVSDIQRLEAAGNEEGAARIRENLERSAARLENEVATSGIISGPDGSKYDINTGEFVVPPGTEYVTGLYEDGTTKVLDANDPASIEAAVDEGLVGFTKLEQADAIDRQSFDFDEVDEAQLATRKVLRSVNLVTELVRRQGAGQTIAGQLASMVNALNTEAEQIMGMIRSAGFVTDDDGNIPQDRRLKIQGALEEQGITDQEIQAAYVPLIYAAAAAAGQDKRAASDKDIQFFAKQVGAGRSDPATALRLLKALQEETLASFEDRRGLLASRVDTLPDYDRQETFGDLITDFSFLDTEEGGNNDARPPQPPGMSVPQGYQPKFQNGRWGVTDGTNFFPYSGGNE